MRVLLVAVILMYSVHESHESYASRYEIRRYLYAAHEYKRLHGLVTELLKGEAQTANKKNFLHCRINNVF